MLAPTFAVAPLIMTKTAPPFAEIVITRPLLVTVTTGATPVGTFFVGFGVGLVMGLTIGFLVGFGVGLITGFFVGLVVGVGFGVGGTFAGRTVTSKVKDAAL